MKIALNTTIASKTRTGTGNYAVNLAAALMQMDHGHEIEIYCNDDLHDWFAGQRNGHSATINGIKIKSSRRRVFWEQTKLSGELKKNGVDLLHSMAFTSPWMNSIKTVVTVHDLAFRKYPETIPLTKRIYYRPIFSHSIKKADKVVVPSRAVRKSLCKTFHLNEEKVVCVTEGVTADFFNSMNEKTIDATRKKIGIAGPYLLTVGTLEPRKNLATILGAFNKLKTEKGIPHQLVVAGKEGWLIKKSMDESPDLISTGYVSQQDLIALYRGAELFLFPSLYEGFGLPLLEAMAAGVPVIASELPVHREVCGEAALFANPLDEEEWRNTIDQLLQNSSQQKRLRTNGIERAKKFSWQKTAERTMEIYESVKPNALRPQGCDINQLEI